MRKILLFATFFLLLLPAMRVRNSFTLSAQNMTYENGSWWLPEVEVEGRSKMMCTWCGNCYYEDEAADHVCTRECEYCHQLVDYFSYYEHVESEHSGNSDDNSYCTFCHCLLVGEEVWTHDCQHTTVIGNGGGNPSGGGTGSNAGGGSFYSGGGNGSTSTSGHRTTIAKQDEAVRSAVQIMKQQYGKKMACNIGVQYVAKAIFGDVPSTLKGSANDIYKKISSSSAWQQISAEQAGRYANDGFFVVGVWYGPAGNPPSDNGHIVFVRPTTNGKVEVMDTGYGNGSEAGTPGKRERQSINQSFRPSRRGQVKYYYYK